MRLNDLDPRWIVQDGRRIGFCFVSPAQPKRSDGTSHPDPWRQTCFVVMTPRSLQREIFEGMFGENDFRVQGCRPDFAWTVAGGIDAATFETMTVTPSLDGSAGGLWHGFITNGEIR